MNCVVMARGALSFVVPRDFLLPDKTVSKVATDFGVQKVLQGLAVRGVMDPTGMDLKNDLDAVS